MPQSAVRFPGLPHLSRVSVDLIEATALVRFGET